MAEETTATQTATQDPEKSAGVEQGDERFDFPEKTPLAEMSPQQQVEYWRHKARVHEGRVKAQSDYDAVVAERDRLKAATLSDTEKALEDARREAREQAATQARQEYAPRLVSAKIEAVVAGRIPADRLTALLEPLDLTKFLTTSGEVDADKVSAYVSGLVPADGKKWPDMGQGRRESQKATGVSAGRDLFAARTKK